MADRFDTSRDPRFKKAPKHVRKVEVDGRFAHMFKDKDFVEAPKVDSRGQRVKGNAARNKLREFYELADESEPTKDKKGGKAPIKKKASKAIEPEEVEEDANEDEDNDAQQDEDVDADAEENDDETDDEDEESEDGDDAEEEVDTTAWEGAGADVPRGDASKKLVLMGCDWDRVSATDLLVMMRTYLKSKGRRSEGSVDKVSVYPSDYGLEQMAQENKSGPSGAIFDSVASKPQPAVEDENEDVANSAQVEALRRYQMQRTKYYYAVAECDSVQTASWLYDQLDSMEADGICLGTLDLRFVPDDLEFPHEPDNFATEVPKRYQAPDMAEKGTLGHTKVQCTWDDAPIKRKRDLMRKRFTPEEMRESDLQAYMASTSEEENESGAETLRSLVRPEGGDDDDFFNEAERDKFLDGDSDEEVDDETMGNKEATFSATAIQLEDQLTEKIKKDGQAGRKVHTLTAGEDEPKSVWDKFLQKRKEKRKERRQQAKSEREARKKGGNAEEEAEDDDEEDEANEKELELLTIDGQEGGERGFNLRGKKRGDGGKARVKANKAGDGEFKVDVNDPRISSVFNSADFEIDPTNPEYRGSDGMKAVLKKKRAKKTKPQNSATASLPAASASSELATARSTSKAPAPGQSSVSSAPLGTGGLQLFAARKRPAPPVEVRGDRASSGGSVKKGKKKKTMLMM